MGKLGTLYLFVYIAGINACNPGPNVTSLGTPNATDRPRPIPVASTIDAAKVKVPSIITEKENVPLLEKYAPNCHNDNKGNDSTSNSYQHIIVSGLPFQRGESHGRQTKDKIWKLISFYKTSSLMPSWSDCINFVRTNYLEALNYYYPNGLEEMKGIAEGAGVQLEDILILNSKYELMRWKKSADLKSHIGFSAMKARHSSELPECNIRQIQFNATATDAGSAKATSTDEETERNSIGGEGTDECTGAVALSSSTKYAHILLGQNWDTNEFMLENDTAILLEVYPDPCENIKPFVMLTEAGQLGNTGMNSEGLGVVAMSLSSSGDTFQRSTERGWIPTSMLRRIFLESPNFSMGLHAILTAPIHVSVNMIIATAEDEALNLELTPNNYFTSQIPLDKEVFAHSNNFKSASFIAQHDIKEIPHGSSSLFRDRRVERHLMNDWPRITEDTFHFAFKDQVGSPNAVCEPSVPKNRTWTSVSHQKITVASIILNLSQRTLQLAKGPPCTGVYKNYCFKFSEL